MNNFKKILVLGILSLILTSLLTPENKPAIPVWGNPSGIIKPIKNKTTLDSQIQMFKNRSPEKAKAYAKYLGKTKYHWNNSEFKCLVRLWTKESNWRWNARNKYSGAYGIPQSVPGDKMADMGSDWRQNARTQIKWGMDYIKRRYSNPCNALRYSNIHNWY